MRQTEYSAPEEEVLDPTGARQAIPRKMNSRVLTASLALAVALGIVLVFFWNTRPAGMDHSSSGNLGEQQTTPQPHQAPTGAAPEAAPPPAAPSPPVSPTPP